MKDKLIVWVVSAILAVAAGLLSAKSPVVNVQAPQMPRVGALSSPDIASPFISFGNVRDWAVGTSLLSATGTVCAIQSPAATTTLLTASIRVDNTNVSYAVGPWTINKSATEGGTTVQLAGSPSIAANGQDAVIATTSVTQLKDGIVAPNSWINFNDGSSTPSALFAPTGKCSVEFREI